MARSLSYQSHKISQFGGDARVPGDKSMSHRALMLGGLTKGETRIMGLLEGHDVLNTAAVMRAMGANIVKGDDDIWRCHGTGIGGLVEADHVLDLGNSGTSARLLLGLVSGYDFTTIFTGDASLVKRPMGRVMTPLNQMGAQFIARGDARLPLSVRGKNPLKAITYETPVASAQIKSAILLAGLMANGQTTVIETAPSRDHSENMLRAFGAEVQTGTMSDKADDTRLYASVTGFPTFHECSIDIPCDPSSAAFPAAAASLQPGAMITLRNMGINPRRIGFFETLQEMGVDIRYVNEQVQAGEAVADVKILAPDILRAVDVPAERVPSMIDEFPILAVLAACADGVSHFTGLAELRVKESDRLGLMAKGLEDCGVKVEAGDDWMTIHGMAGQDGTGRPAGGAFIHTHLDHRIAMSFLVLGSVSDQPITIDDAGPIDTSFPNFIGFMNDLGADLRQIGME